MMGEWKDRRKRCCKSDYITEAQYLGIETIQFNCEDKTTIHFWKGIEMSGSLNMVHFILSLNSRNGRTGE